MDVDELIGEHSDNVPKRDAGEKCNGKRVENNTGTFRGYCKNPAGKGTDHFGEGRCSHHGGDTPTAEENPKQGRGDQEGNGNAAKHNLHANRNKLYDRLDEYHRNEVDRLEAAFIDRYINFHNIDPDYGARKRIFRSAMDIVKQDLADEWLVEKGEESGHLLIEDYVIGQDEDGRPITAQVPNNILSTASQLRQQTRMVLKDMGLQDDPESQKADAMKDLNLEINYTRVTEDNVDEFVGE